MCISTISSLHQHTPLIQLHYCMALCFVVPYIRAQQQSSHLRGSYNCLLFLMHVSKPSRLMCYRFSAVITDGIKVMTNYSCLPVNTNVFIWYCLFVSLSAFITLAFRDQAQRTASAREGLFSLTPEYMQQFPGAMQNTRQMAHEQVC